MHVRYITRRRKGDWEFIEIACMHLLTWKLIILEMLQVVILDRGERQESRAEPVFRNTREDRVVAHKYSIFLIEGTVTQILDTTSSCFDTGALAPDR
jgi:hypothetical protein